MTATTRLRVAAVALGAFLLLGPCASIVEAAKAKKPAVSLRVTPRMAFSPVSIFATLELQGGDDDHPDYYCLGVEWDWDDGSRSSHAADCEPYVEGAKIQRRFTAEHTYSRPGAFNVRARLMNGNKVVATSSFQVTVRQGVPRGPDAAANRSPVAAAR